MLTATRDRVVVLHRGGGIELRSKAVLADESRGRSCEVRLFCLGASAVMGGVS